MPMANTPKRKPATKNRTPKKAKAPVSKRRDPSHEEISRRAYELFEQRGGMHGQEHDDWLRAERELRGDERE